MASSCKFLRTLKGRGELGPWSGESKVGSLERGSGVESLEWGVCLEGGFWRGESGVGSLDWGVWSGEFRVGSLKWGV